MARAGASKSLDKAAAPAPPAKAAAKTVRKKAEPAAVASKPSVKPAAKTGGGAAKATARPAPKAVKGAKTVKTTGPVAKAVKSAPAKAVNVKAKAAPAAKTPPTRQNSSEVAQVAEAKGKRAATATKAPAKPAAPAPVPVADAGFPAKTLEKLRRLLEEERETYVRQARDLAAEAEALATEREPGDTQFDEESGEGDTLNVERERDLALSASATQAVEEIDRALSRMDGGSYGICEKCGRKIGVARLEALPFAALCIECKSREERRR
jgi:RNA polymerase-binding protein DksA